MSHENKQTIQIKVKPNSRKGSFIRSGVDGLLEVGVTESAVDGKANEAVIKLLADHFNVAKSNISIIRGQTSRLKTIKIEK